MYSLQAGLSVSETYDDNVARSEKDRRDDFITTVGASLSLTASGPRLTASAGYGIGTSFFARKTEDTELTHTGSLALAYAATEGLTFRLGDSATIAWTEEPDAALALPPRAAEPGPGPTPTQPPPAIAPGSVPTRRVRRFANSTSAGMEYQAGADTALGVGYTFQTTDYDAPDLVDSMTHGASLGASRRVTRDDSVQAAYSASIFLFDAPGIEDSWTQEATLTWSHVFSPGVTGSVGAGAAWTDRGRARPRLLGDASISKQVGLTRVQVTYSSGLETSGGTGEILRSDRVAVGLSRDLSARVTAHAAGAVSRNEPLENSPGATYGYSTVAGVGAVLTRSLRAALTYSYQRADAPPGGESFYDNQVTASLTLALPPLVSRQF